MKAYPHTKHFSDYHDNDNMNGMDLRDYFAAKAMQGVLASLNPNYPVQLKDFTENAYVMADAMMKARNSK